MHFLDISIIALALMDILESDDGLDIHPNHFTTASLAGLHILVVPLLSRYISFDVFDDSRVFAVAADVLVFVLGGILYSKKYNTSAFWTESHLGEYVYSSSTPSTVS